MDVSRHADAVGDIFRDSVSAEASDKQPSVTCFDFTLLLLSLDEFFSTGYQYTNGR
jgi:hypothetical protein